MSRLGANALGEVLEPGPRVRLLPRSAPGTTQEPEARSMLVVAPAALLHPVVPQPDGTLLMSW